MGSHHRLKYLLPAVAILVLVLYLGTSLAMAYFATRPERHPFEAQPEDYSLTYEDVSFTPRDSSLTLRGWLLRGSQDAPYLIFVHGIGDQRTGNDALELASRLVKSDGYNVLLFDLRAQGTSDGSYVSAGDFERDDVLGAYDFLVGRGAQPGRIGLIGRSYGAAIAILAAAKEPGFAAVVADSPFADVRDRIVKETARKTPLPEAVVPVFVPPAALFADILFDIDLGDIRPAREASKLAYPLLIVHGEADTRIPVAEGRRVYEAAPVGSEFWSVPEAGHCQAFQILPEEYIRRLETYLTSRFR